MKYIVFKTVNKLNGKFYVGIHETDVLWDGYLGDGITTDKPISYTRRKTPLQYAVAKYGVKNFIRTTLRVFDTEEDAYKLEAEIVNEDFVKRDDTYNIVLGGRDTSQFMVKVYMYDLDGNFEMEFESLIAAAKYLNPDAKGGGHLPRAIKNRH